MTKVCKCKCGLQAVSPWRWNTFKWQGTGWGTGIPLFYFMLCSDLRVSLTSRKRSLCPSFGLQKDTHRVVHRKNTG